MQLLPLERVPLAGIARVMKLSESWLQKYVNKYYEEIPRKAEVMPKEPGKLIVQMDELWSFVGNKGNKQWVWLAIDTKTREIIGCHIGDRSKVSMGVIASGVPTVRQDLH